MGLALLLVLVESVRSWGRGAPGSCRGPVPSQAGTGKSSQEGLLKDPVDLGAKPPVSGLDLSLFSDELFNLRWPFPPVYVRVKFS